MKFSALCLGAILASTPAVYGAGAANNKKQQLRRRIQQYLNSDHHKQRAFNRELAAKTIDSQRRRAQMLPEGEKGVAWEAGSYSWGTTLRDANGDRVRANNGIMGRAIGYQGEPVAFADGTSGDPMHGSADGAAVIPKEDGTGYYYVSNSEEGDIDDKAGGVYVFELDLDHDVIDYYQVLSGTVDNCGSGGSTPWGTFVSCEEEDGYGHCWQVDPANKDQTGPTKSQKTAVTGYPGNWEAFAWDDIGKQGYVTDDAEPEDAPESYGCFNRFTPDPTAMACYDRDTKEGRWCTLNSGTVDYMTLTPDAIGSNCGTIGWTKNPAECSAGMYRNGEGMDITDQMLTFTAKRDRLMFEINLKDQTYCTKSTLEGFPQEPDQIRVHDGVLYFCTDGNNPNGVLAYDGKGYYSIVQEIDYNTETSGLAFSPDGMVMYVAFQDNAIWQFWRADGKPFEKADPSYIPVGADFFTVQQTDIALGHAVVDLVMEVLEEEGLIEGR